MATENLSQEAELRLRITSDDPAAIIKALERLRGEVEAAGKDTKLLDNLLNNIGKSFSGAGSAAKKSGKDIRSGAEEGSKAWQKLVKELEKADKAQRKFDQGILTGEGGGRDASTYSPNKQARLQDTRAALGSTSTKAITDADKASLAQERAFQKEREDLAKRQVAAERQQNAELARIRRERASAAREAGEVEVNAQARVLQDKVAAGQRERRLLQGSGGAQMSTAAWDREFAALERATNATENFTASLPRLRYALYDISSTASTTALALAAMGTATLVSFAKVESAFTQVERTINPAELAKAGLTIGDLNSQLNEMAGRSPIPYQDLAGIAALGNQLGVAAGDLMEFTDVVAQFSAVSGMTAEASAQAFGKLSNILGFPIDKMRYLASSIEAVGVDSAATDQEIIALAQRLGASATRAGFLASEVVGLSGALGSLGVAPERAQGVFETYFNSLNESLNEGGEKLQAFSRITGMAIDDLNEKVRTGQGFEVFSAAIQGLQGQDTASLSADLDMLGLSGLRANEVVGRLAGQLPLLEKSFGIASEAMREGTELQRQYAFVLDDLATKWQAFLNKLLLFGSAVGSAVAPALISLMSGVGDLLSFLTDLAETPLGAWAIQAAALIGGLVAVFAAVVGGVALSAAAMLAIRTAFTELGVSAGGASGMVRNLALSLGLVPAAAGVATGAAGRAAAAFRLLSGAALAVGRAIPLLLAFQGVTAALADLRGAGLNVIDVFFGIADAAVSVFGQIGHFFNDITGGALKGLTKLQADVRSEIGKAKTVARREFGNFADDMKWTTPEPDGIEEFNELLAATRWDGAIGSAGEYADGLEDVGDAADEAARKVVTLVDYANDLGGVMSRAFDIRYGGEQALDKIAGAWNKIKNEADAAREAIAEHQRTIASLSQDTSILKYWLSVAEAYGDEKRAAAIRVELAEANAKIAEEQKALSAEQAKASGTLKGNTDAAIANRGEILGLVGDYQSYLQALASSGMSQAELSAKSAQLKNEFIQQALQMGYSRDEVYRYAQSFDDMKVSIDNVPRNITVTANVNPALQALNEFVARAAEAGANAASSMAGALQDAPWGSVGNSIGNQVGSAAGAAVGAAVAAAAKPNIADLFIPGRSFNFGKFSGRRSGGGSFASGGFTGPGAKYTAAGVVHRNEYVMPSETVRSVGLRNLAYIHKTGRLPGYSSGGYVGGSTPNVGSSGGFPSVMALDAGTIHALARAVSTQFSVDGQLLGRSVGNQFTRNTTLGGN